MGGMITATVLAIFLVPVFFVVVRSRFKGSKAQHEREQARDEERELHVVEQHERQCHGKCREHDDEEQVRQ